MNVQRIVLITLSKVIITKQQKTQHVVNVILLA